LTLPGTLKTQAKRNKKRRVLRRPFQEERGEKRLSQTVMGKKVFRRKNS